MPLSMKALTATWVPEPSLPWVVQPEPFGFGPAGTHEITPEALAKYRAVAKAEAERLRAERGER